MHQFHKPSNPVVTLNVKDFGTMTIELFPEVVPNTVYNFIDLVETNYFSGTIFHRIIPNFMIQGGQGATRRPIKGDFRTNGVDNPIVHDRGVISMARTSYANSATSQFFIMHQKSPHLDGQYAGFGIVTSGFEVIDKIVSSKRDYSDKPLKDIVIESATVDLKGLTYRKPTLL